MDRYDRVARACILVAIALGGCNEGDVAVPGDTHGGVLVAAPDDGSPETVDGGAQPTSSASGSSGGGAAPMTPSPSIVVASSWSALVNAQYARSFDVRTTADLLVLASVGSAYDGGTLGLNFLSPSGGTLAGYTAVVSGGAAHFNVKLGGTVVGESAQTGTFALVLGDLVTQREIARTTIALVKEGAQ